MNQKSKSINTKKLFASGVLILTISNLVVKIIGLTLKIPLTKLIGNEGMGYYSSTYDIYAWLYMISTAGIPVAISLMISNAKAKGNFIEIRRIYKIALRLMIVVGVIATGILCGFSKLFATYLYSLDGLWIPILVIAPVVLFECICSAFRGYFQGYQYMLPTAVSEVIEALGELVLGLSCAYIGMKIIPDTDPYKYPKVAGLAILGQTVAVFVGVIYLLIKKKRFKNSLYNSEFALKQENSFEYRFSYRSDKKLLKVLVAIAIPITISSSIMSLTNMIDGMIISNRLQSIGYDESFAAETIGYFKTQVVTFFNLPPALIYPISASLVPFLSSYISSGKIQKSKTIMNSSLKIASIISMPCALGMSVLSEPIIKLVYSSTYDEHSKLCLSIQAIAVIFVAILSMTNAILQSHKLERLPIISMIIGSIIKLITSYILIGNKDITIYGAPIGTVLCYFVIACVNLYFVKKYVKFTPRIFSVFLKPLFCSIVCAISARAVYSLLVIFISNALSVLIAILIAAIVYIIVLFASKSVDKNDLAILPKGDKIENVLRKCKLVK